MKYKVGDKVKVRSWESMEAEFGLNCDAIDNPGYCFVESMKQYCGKCVTISRCHNDYYDIEEDECQWSWDDTMFEDEEDIELVSSDESVDSSDPVMHQYLIVNILSGIMFTVEDEQYLFTKEQVIEHLNNDIAYPSQWTVVSVNETFNVESILKEVK